MNKYTSYILAGVAILMIGFFASQSGGPLTNLSTKSNLAAISGAGSGLVAHYTFDGNANDVVGGNHGTPVGSPTYVTGRIGEAFSANANYTGGTSNGSFIALPQNSIQAGNGDFTISAWANYQGSGYGVIVSTQESGGGGQTGYSLGFSSANSVYLRVDNSSFSRSVTAASVSPGWHHIVGVFKQGTSMSLYIDGVLQQAQTTNVPSGNITGPKVPRIGDVAQFASGDSRVWLPFKGYIDDVKFYNRELTVNEVQEIYGLTSGGGDPQPPTLDTQAPSTPTNLQATAQSSSQINLTWTSSTDNVGVSQYLIFRNGVNIGTSNTNSYSNTGLSPNTTYSYTVVARDAALNSSSQSSSVTATTQSTQVGTYTLTVSKSGTGGGTITSSPTGINFGSDASETYNQGTSIILSASADSGSSFTGWSGGGCSGTGTCTVVLNSNITVTAAFTTNTPIAGAPLISNVYHKRNSAQTAVTINWETNEPADTQVEYGLTTAYGSQTTLNNSMLTAHTATISGLVPNPSVSTTYHYRLKSRDASGALTTSPDYTFTLLPTPNTSGPELCKGTNCVRLQKNMTWAFLGDSITSINLYNTYMEMYFHLRYPELDLHFREEARSGSTIGDLLPEFMTNAGVRIPNSGTPRFLSEVYPLNPQADIMSIMWAGNGGLLASTYRSMMTDLIDDYVVGKSNATPILLGGIPANTADGSNVQQRENDLSVNIGQQKRIPYVDLWNTLRPIWYQNYLLGSSNPSWVDLQQGGDDIHFGPSGHISIAHQILKQLGAESEVSSAIINASGSGQLVSQSNATISNISKSGDTLSFRRLDARSPFIIPNGADVILKLQPYILDDLSKYMLKVTNLTPGTYEVKVNGVVSGRVGSNILASGDGWNMSYMKQGPIYDKAINVLNKIQLERGQRDDPATANHYLSAYQGLVGCGTATGWLGEVNYRSNAGDSYTRLGLRGEELRNRLTSLTHNVPCTNRDLTLADQNIWNAAEPEAWNFTLTKVGDDSNFSETNIYTPTPSAPTISIHPQNRSGSAGGTATFSVSATGNPSPTYQWQKNGVNISSATNSSYTTPTLSLSDNNAVYRVVITNPHGSVTSNGATLTVTASDPLAPVISGGTPTGTLARGTTQATLSVVTNKLATCKYSTNANTAYASMTNTFYTTGTMNHSTTLTGLQNGISYTYYVRCIDTANNVNTSDYPVSFSVSNQVGSLRAWTYPGVPYTDWAYDPFTHPAPARPTEWPNGAKQNYYFIAPNDVNATDVVTAGEPVDANGKRFGYPNKPRKTLPLISQNLNSFPAGTVFWMKGGEYNAVLGGGESFGISSLSTPANPFWVYGDPDDKPVFKNARILISNSSYGFIENIIFDDSIKGSGAISFGGYEGDTHHITVRNVTVQNRRYVSHGALMAVAAPGATIVNGDIHDIVFYKLKFKNNGGGVNWNLVDADMHAYKLNGTWNQNRAYRIWIIENDVRKGDTPDPIDGFYKSLAGDFVQVGDQLVTQGNVDHIWVAGNYNEGMRQGCVGFKRSGHAVVSSNVCKDLSKNATSQGQAFNVKYDRQENLWFVNNYVENVDSFIIRAETTSSGAGGPDTFRPIDTRIYIIGNVFKNSMRQPWNAPDMGGIGGWKTKGISIQDMNGKVYVANNVIDTSVYGVYFAPLSHRQSVGSEMHVYNNIAVNLSAGLDTSTAANNGIMVTTDTNSEWFIENNLVENGRYYYSGTQYNSAADFNARVNASGNMQGNPIFTNPAAGDYTLRPGSPAIDAGIRNYTTNSSPDVYQLFINAFDNDPDFPGDPRDVWPKDMSKNARFSGSNIDIGAFEYGSTGGGTYTPPPVIPPQTPLDSDSDGIPDSIDRCPATPSNIRSLVNSSGCVLPRINTFDIRPTMSAYDLTSVSALELGRTGLGKVRWNQAVRVTRDTEEMNIDGGLTFTQNKVSLNPTSLPELNRPAQITFFNVNLTNPKILRNGTECPSSICSINSFTNGTLVTTVTGFSDYEVVEGTIPPVIVPDTYIPPAPQVVVSGGGGGGFTAGGISVTTSGANPNNNSIPGCTPGNIFSTVTGERCPITQSSNTSSFTKTLRLGMRDGEVKSLQQYLNTNGYTVSTTGLGSSGNESTYFGPATRAALIRYQAANQLTPDGIFGPRTRATITSGSVQITVSSPISNQVSAPVSSGVSLRLNSSGPAVKALRQKLREAGYLAPYGSSPDVPASAATETSNFGITTESVLKRYQCDKNIVCSGSAATTGWGVVGQRTRASLGL